MLFSKAAKEKRIEKEIQAPELSRWEKDTLELTRIRSMKSGPERNAAIAAYSKPIPKTWRDKSWVLGNWAMSLATFGISVNNLFHHPEYLHLVPHLQLLTWYFTDFSTQIYHKWLDSIASPTGKYGSSVDDFRKHHEYPNNLAEEGYLANASTPARPMAPFFAVNLLVASSLPGSVSLATNTWLLGIMSTVEIHKQAHLGSKADPFFKAGQKVGLFVSHDVHMAHHKPPFDDNFAVFSGWFNPMAKRTRLWEKWDRYKWRKTRELPNTWIQDPSSIPPDVIEELKANSALIPPELWRTGDVYPLRVSPQIKDLLAAAKDNWRVQFTLRRRKLYQEATIMDQTGKTEKDYSTDWEAEQKNYPWIYGNETIPLFDEKAE